MIWRILILILLIPAPGFAGPWLREKGDVFAASELEIRDQHGFFSTYFEYGARPRLTLGLDINSDYYGRGTVLVFARFPLWQGRHARISTELGLGADFNLTELDPTWRPGISWGRGFTLWQKSGWMTLDATVAYTPKYDVMTPKLSATIGLNLSDRAKLILNLVGEKSTGAEPILTVAPELAWRFGQKTHLLIGLKLRSLSDSHGIKLGLWRDF